MKEIQSIAPFVRVTDVTELIPILLSRLPESSHVYNTALMHPKFENEIKLYTLDVDTDLCSVNYSKNVWIIFIYTRKDICQDVTISVPENVQVSEAVKSAFFNTSIFDWSKSFSFSSIVRPISLLVCEISLFKGKNVKLIPCTSYYCPKEDAMAIDTSHDDEVELKPLDLTSGPTFTYNSWAYAVEGSLEYITETIERNISSGVYTKKDGKPISGILTVATGVMGMLYTDKGYRNKNYGKLCMQKLMKDLAVNGYIPCSAVEICNEASRNFHIKIGMKPWNDVDYIRYDGPTKFK